MHPDLRRALPRSWLDPLVRLVAQTGITPNALTWLGFVLSAGAGLMAAVGLFPLAGGLSLLAGGLDLLDGALARATNQTTRFGALLDSTLDRYSEAMLLGGLLIAAALRQALEELVLVFVALVGSLMVSYVKARAEGLGFSCEVGVLTRAERVVILGIGLITGLVVPALAVVAVLANLTALQRLVHVWRSAQRGEEKNGPR